MTATDPARGPDVPRVLGRYTLGRRLGEGGMGVVHHATRDDGRQVAIKVLRPHIAHDPDARTRLEREVSTLARVDSPRVAAVLDADVDGEAPYIVTQYVPGVALDTVVTEQGPVAGPALVRLGRGLLEALEAIHRVGIVHRDLKPGNVLMVGRDPVVIDFGIAQVADDVRLTMTGLVMGTPGYLSPEVVEGGAVTVATDQWGWAATLAYAASGEPPFGRGPMPVVLDRVIRGRTQLGGVDPALRPLLAAALQPDPARRPGPDEVMHALELYASRRPVTQALSTPPPAPDQPGSPSAATGYQPAVPRTRAQPVAPTPQTRTQPVAPTPRTRAQPVAPTPQTRAQPVAPTPDGYQQPWQGRSDAAPSPYAAPSPRYSATPPYAEPSPYAAPSHPYAEPSPSGAPSPYADPSPYGGPTPYAGPGGAYPPGPAPDPGRPGDPRIGRAARSWSLAALLAAFVGLAAAAPLLAWGAYVVWSVTARTTDHAVTALVVRRHESGRRRSDVPMAVASGPWHLLLGVLGTVLALLLPLAFAVATALATALVLSQTGTVDVGYEHPVPIGIGSALGAVIAWWGPGGRSLRRGSRTLVRAGLPPGLATQLGVAVLLAAGVGLAVWSVLDGDTVSWFPWPDDRAPFADLVPRLLRP